MGKVLKMLNKIRNMNDIDLLDRFEHLVGAKAVRDYLAMKEDIDLTLEIRLSKEELNKRIPSRAISGLRR
jgi:hypothetical protein